MNADPQRIGMGSGEGEVLRIADTWAAAELRGDTSVLGRRSRTTSSGSDRAGSC